MKPPHAQAQAPASLQSFMTTAGSPNTTKVGDDDNLVSELCPSATWRQDQGLGQQAAQFMGTFVDSQWNISWQCLPEKMMMMLFQKAT